MSKFPRKTAYELRCYFNQHSLNQLLDINRSYGPHFLSLDARIDECKNALKETNTRLAYFIEKKGALLQTYEEVASHEAHYQASRKAVLSESDQTDRLLGLKSIGASPMETYEYEERCIEGEISKSSDQIKHMNESIASLEQKVSAAVSELRILNSVIDEKKQHLLAENANTNKLGL